MITHSSSQRLFIAAAVLALGVVGAALVTQHVLEMLPCPWCVLQRLIFVGIAGVALVGAFVPGTLAQRAAAAVMLLGAACGAAAALYQHFVASSSTSCNLSLADRIMSATGLDAMFPNVFAAWTTCADAAAKLLGIPYEFWSLAVFIALGAVAARLLFGRA